MVNICEGNKQKSKLNIKEARKKQDRQTKQEYKRCKFCDEDILSAEIKTHKCCRFGRCRKCGGDILHPGMDAEYCVNCGWVETIWGENYYRLKKIEAEAKKEQRKEEKKKAKEAKQRKEEEDLMKERGYIQHSIFDMEETE